MCVDNNLPEVPPEENDSDLDLGIYDHQFADQDFEMLEPLLAGRRVQNFIIRNHFT